jgi:hypothetical protein
MNVQINAYDFDSLKDSKITMGEENITAAELVLCDCYYLLPLLLYFAL